MLKKLILGVGCLLMAAIVKADMINGTYPPGSSSGGITPGATYYIQVRDTLQSGATFYVASGTVNGSFSLNGEFKTGLTSSTSGQILASQGASAAPKFQWGGRVGNIQSYTITAATATTVTTAFVNTSLTGTILTLSATSKVLVLVSGTCQAAAADLGFVTIARAGSNILSSSGAFRQNSTAGVTDQTACGFVYLDSPASAGTLTYTVQMKSNSGGSFQFGESNATSSMILIELPQ